MTLRFPINVLAMVCICWSVVLIAPVSGQQPAPDSGELQVQQDAAFTPETWSGTLNSVEQALTREGVTDEELAELIAETAGIRDDALAASLDWREQLQLVKERLDALGPEPKEGEPPEAEETRESRKAINEEYSEVDGNAKEASDIAVRASQLRSKAVELRHTRFFRQISARSPVMFEQGFVGRFIEGLALFPRPFGLLLSDSASAFADHAANRPFNLLFLFAALLLTALLYLRAERYLESLREGLTRENADPRVIVFAGFLKSGILPAFTCLFVFWLFSFMGFVATRLHEFLSTGLLMAIVGFLAILLARLLLATDSTVSRLTAFSAKTARAISSCISVGLGIAIFLSLADLLSLIFVLPIEVGVGLSFLTSVATGATSIAALELARRGYGDRPDVEARSLFWRLTGWVIWVVAPVIILAALTGYVAFAEFLSQQLVFGFVVLLSAWLLLKFVDFLSTNWLEPSTSNKATSGGRQFAIFANGLIHLAIYCTAAIAMLIPWGYRTSDLVYQFQSSFFGLQVGEINISVYNILTAIILFALGFWITRSLRSWIGQRFLPSTNLDIGLRNSITTMFGYVGLGIAALMAIGAAGFDLSNLAIVAGALSLGIGFGLQSIINNFVSGLILLAERPIKSGDWIQTTDGEGIVRKISVRSTEIQTFDQATTIIPNSTLITDRVTNLTHLNKNGRLVLNIGVGYDSDPQQVRELLLACAEEHPRIKKVPAPNVYFMEFGASSLDFSLRCYLYDVNERLSVQSDLRFAVLGAMREQNIEIPFPQRVVTLNPPVDRN